MKCEKCGKACLYLGGFELYNIDGEVKRLCDGCVQLIQLESSKPKGASK